MRTACVLAFAILVGIPVAGHSDDRPFESGVCLSRARIELGTFAAVQVYVKNISHQDIVVGGPKVDLPQRYRTCRKLPDCPSPGPFVELKPGEIHFWSYPVPKDHGFTPLLLGRYEATVTYEVRWGEGRERFVGVPAGWEDKRVPPAPPEGREVFRVPISYEIVEPGEEMAAMRQRYTKEIEACDLLQGGKQVMVQELDVSAAEMDARNEVTQLLGPRLQGQCDATKKRERLAAEFEHPAHRAAMRFQRYVGPRGSTGFDYQQALQSLEWYLRQTVWRLTGLPTEEELNARERGKEAGGDAFEVSYAQYVFSREGSSAALAYLRSLDTSGFNCADRAFYNEFLEHIEKAQARKLQTNQQDTPEPPRQ
jgi:hypothetical protein